MSALVVLLTVAGFSTSVFASQNEDLSKVELDQIKNACKEDARDAENPQWYADECVDERIQALKEEKGLVKPKEDS